MSSLSPLWDRRGLQSATAFQTVWITIFTSDFPPTSHHPLHPHPDHVYHHFDHHLPNHHLLHHHHPHLSWASSLFKGNPLFPSQLRRLQDELQPKFYFSSSFFVIFIILAILTPIDIFTISTPSILMLGLFVSIFLSFFFSSGTSRALFLWRWRW